MRDIGKIVGWLDPRWRPRPRKPLADQVDRDEEMVPRWTAEDEIALARRVARAQG